MTGRTSNLWMRRGGTKSTIKNGKRRVRAEVMDSARAQLAAKQVRLERSETREEKRSWMPRLAVSKKELKTLWCRQAAESDREEENAPAACSSWSISIAEELNCEMDMDSTHRAIKDSIKKRTLKRNGGPAEFDRWRLIIRSSSQALSAFLFGISL